MFENVQMDTKKTVAEWTISFRNEKWVILVQMK